MTPIAERLFQLSPDIRYVALYVGGELALAERPGLANASAAESDRYEELIVNPTVITVTRQRGEIDCGGLDFVLIRYGSFYQMVHPVKGGHLSVAFEPHGDPLGTQPRVLEIAREFGLLG